MQRALAAAIRGYRRWLSGRGPLARVRCSFHASESCSAFGLRAATSAPSTWQAVGRIRRRLRRCRDVSLYALPGEHGRHVLGWGADHDRDLDELRAELARDDESPAARALILTARELVARWRSDPRELAALHPHRHGLPPSAVALRAPPPPRRVRVAPLAVILALLVALALVAPWAAVAALVLTAGLAWRSRRARLSLRRRLRAQRDAASLRGALPILDATSARSVLP